MESIKYPSRVRKLRSQQVAEQRRARATSKGAQALSRTMASDVMVSEDGKNTDLHVAVKAMDITEVRLLLKERANLLNVQNHNGVTPLMVAVALGSELCVAEMVQADADLSLTNVKQYNVVLLAACNNNPSIMEALLSPVPHQGKPPAPHILDAQSPSGLTAMHWCCVNRNPKMVDMLIRAGASPQLRNQEGQTPFLKAVEYGSVDCMNVLYRASRECIADTDFNGRTGLHWAAHIGHRDAVRWLVRRVPKSKLALKDNQGWSPAELAVACGAGDVLAVLSKAGVRIPRVGEELGSGEGDVDVIDSAWERSGVWKLLCRTNPGEEEEWAHSGNAFCGIDRDACIIS